jgi:cyclopropane-fatty-acyl-phospholipid synthase
VTSALEREGLRDLPRSGRIGTGRIAKRIVLDALERLEGGTFEVTLPDGTRHEFGDGCGPRAAVQVLSDDMWRRIARRGRTGLGESYVAGDWVADDLPAALGLLLANARNAATRFPIRQLAAVQPAVPRLPSPRTRERARRDIRYHYDLGNDLFRLFLDESLTYSCAYYEHPGQSLADAQQSKYRRLCEKLRIGPGDHVLEIGCGWGGFAIHAAAERGCRVTAVTISTEQHELARRRVADARLDDRVEILFSDYRALAGQFTKIVSIEMVEAVGHRQLTTFFRTCDRLLAPSGLVALQAICVPDQRFERYRRRPDWIQQYVFPGSCLASVTAISDALRRASSLMIHGLEEIGFHYAETLAEWRERFRANRAALRALGYDERFERIWDYYLASCEALFSTRSLRNVQLVLTRSHNAALPEYPERRLTF